MHKWKHAFNNYKDQLPPLYNDYFNSFFKYLNVTSLCMNDTNKVYQDQKPRALARINEIRKRQY